MFSALLSGPVLGLIKGPIFSIIDKLIPDPGLKARLKSEMITKTLAYQDKVASAQRDILLKEVSSGSLLTRSWRPVLMYVIILFLLIYGLVLPIADIITGHPVAFKPRWADIPDGLWNLLSLGVGGYIGGRSLEKIAGSFQKRPTNRKSEPNPSWNRRINLKN
jgi:hypothetical protein